MKFFSKQSIYFLISFKLLRIYCCFFYCLVHREILQIFCVLKKSHSICLFVAYNIFSMFLIYSWFQLLSNWVIYIFRSLYLFDRGKRKKFPTKIGDYSVSPCCSVSYYFSVCLVTLLCIYVLMVILPPYSIVLILFHF